MYTCARNGNESRIAMYSNNGPGGGGGGKVSLGAC